jgi:AAA ATPase domain
MSAETGQARNPYRPGAAIRPVFLAGRDAQQHRFRAILDASPQLPANVRITGLRGVGKSVLLKRLDELAGDTNWLTSRMQAEPRHNRDATLLEAITGLASQAQLRASRAERVKKRLRDVARHTRTLQVTWEDLSFSVDPLAGGRTTSLAKALYDATNAAVEAGFAGYLLMLDEAQVLRDETDRNGQHPLSVLIVAINTLQEQELPIGLVLCGLPSLSLNLLRARTYYRAHVPRRADRRFEPGRRR